MKNELPSSDENSARGEASVTVAAVLREIGEVLRRHNAGLFFTAPAHLWIAGKECGQVMESEGSDGTLLERIDE